MAERNPRIPHSIESLLFVNRNEKYCGYKQELISDNISADLREFLICAECKGISRKPRNWGGNTVCEMCVPEQRIVPEVLLVDINPIPVQYYGDIDKRVENKVAFLNSRCPLSEEGCGWEGKLREIKQHLEECLKVRVEYQLECGIPIEIKIYEQDNRVVCPLKMKRCDYCKQKVQANEENLHKGKCQRHPDTEVPCPYKELGCEAKVLRKNRGIHITENMDSHNKLLQYQINQLNQLRKKNPRLERANQQKKNRNEKLERVTEQQKNTNEKLEIVNVQQKIRNEKLEIVNKQQKNRREELERVNELQKYTNEQQKNKNEKLERVNVQQENRNQQQERVNEQQKIRNQQLERVIVKQKYMNEKLERINEQKVNRNQQLERIDEQQKVMNEELDRANEQQKYMNEELERANEQQKYRNEELERVNGQQRIMNEELVIVNEEIKNNSIWDRARRYFK